MDKNQSKEQFSIAYVSAMAAKVGLSYARPSVDNDSVDLSLSGRGYGGNCRSPKIELQLKCTSRNEIIKDDKLHFSLKLKNYNDLRGEDLTTPRYLVVLIVPENIEKWLELKEDCLILRHLCYWASIRKHPETKNKTSVTIEIPDSQILSCDSLEFLMKKASRGEFI